MVRPMRRVIVGFIAAAAGWRDEMREVMGVVRRTRATGRTLAVAMGAAAIALATVGPSIAAPPAVSLGTAVVDGSAAEWGSNDRFADLFVYGDRSDVRGDVYARYDCDDETLFVYVAATDGQLRADEPNEAWVRIDDAYRSVRGDAGNDGVPPDFAWVGLDGLNATGFEASMAMAPGSHTMFLHVHQWWTDDDLALSLVIVRDTPIIATCPAPSPDVSPSPGVSPSPDVSPSPGASVDPSLSASPTGEVKGITSSPAATPPPTDSVDTVTAARDGLAWVLLGLGLVALAALLVARPRAGTRGR